MFLDAEPDVLRPHHMQRFGIRVGGILERRQFIRGIIVYPILYCRGFQEVSRIGYGIVAPGGWEFDVSNAGAIRRTKTVH